MNQVLCIIKGLCTEETIWGQVYGMSGSGREEVCTISYVEKCMLHLLHQIAFEIEQMELIKMKLSFYMTRVCFAGRYIRISAELWTTCVRGRREAPL